MFNKTIHELRDDLRAKHYSSVELTQFFLDRIQRYDTQINSFISVTAEQALAAAKHADAQLAKGADTSPLLGIPIAHKDIFCTQGVKTSCGSKMLDNFIAPYDATVVTKLHQAGNVLLGKTNMDEFAMGSSNENSHYGPVHNPWDTARVPGGSSGGSAAAVAARLTPASTGTDTGGSIRQPAAFCGVSGLKPTYGRVSRYGMVAFASSLDQGGPLAQSAQDLSWLLSAMAGFDPNDSTSVDQSVPDISLQQSIKGLRIGLPTNFFTNLDADIAKVIQAATDELVGLGAQLVDIELSTCDLSIPAYYIIAPAECSSNLARYDGVRFGLREMPAEEKTSLDQMYEASRGVGFGEEVKRRILLGTFALSSGYYDAYFKKACQVRALVVQGFHKAFKHCDVILGPTTPTPSFVSGGKKDPLQMYLNDIYTVPVNLAGLPALSMPCGETKSGLPIGLQVVGPAFSEQVLLETCASLEFLLDKKG